MISSHPLSERPCSAKQKQIRKKSAHKNNTSEDVPMENYQAFNSVKESQTEVRPMLVKFMSKEGTLRQAMVELKGGNHELLGQKGGNPEPDLRHEFVSLSAPQETDEAKERLSQTRSEHQIKSAKMPEGGKRLVKSAQPKQMQKKSLNGGKGFLKRSSKSFHLSQPKPPPVPFFKFWGGSLPPEARSHAKRETKSRKGSSHERQETSPSDVEICFYDINGGKATATCRKRSARKSAQRKMGPPIASGVVFYNANDVTCSFDTHLYQC